MNTVTPTATFISKTPGVCGGRVCVRSTRIAVWVLQDMRRLGRTDSDILRSYPSLTADDLQAAWQYYAENAKEIDEDIRQNYEDA